MAGGASGGSAGFGAAGEIHGPGGPTAKGGASPESCFGPKVSIRGSSSVARGASGGVSPVSLNRSLSMAAMLSARVSATIERISANFESAVLSVSFRISLISWLALLTLSIISFFAWMTASRLSRNSFADASSFPSSRFEALLCVG